ncbi:hypothetical protein ACFL4T_06650 [candidate division KSB1 bacterium]
MENDQKKNNSAPEEKPPLVSTWKRLYLLVFFNLVFLIILFYIFTKTFQ